MSDYTCFRTDGLLPIVDAVGTFGINAKPKSDSPFGFFGTGLKYAIAVILRHGGNIRFFVDGEEYYFYLYDKDFRGKTFSNIRMKKRKAGFLKFSKSIALPFTTELGKEWELWMAYRELESNTRDEGGYTYLSTDEEEDPKYCGVSGETVILVHHEDFANCIEPAIKLIRDEEYGDWSPWSAVFLDYYQHELVYESDFVDIYDCPSQHFYYQGIRVYDLRNPSRLTYDFKKGQVILSEDRTAKNIWNLQYELASTIQKMTDGDMLEKVLLQGSKPSFETDDLQFYNHYSGSTFSAVARGLGGRVGRMGRNYVGEYYSEEEVPDTTDIELEDELWKAVCEALDEALGAGVLTKSTHELVERALDKIKEHF